MRPRLEVRQASKDVTQLRSLQCAPQALAEDSARQPTRTRTDIRKRGFPLERCQFNSACREVVATCDCVKWPTIASGFPIFGRCLTHINSHPSPDSLQVMQVKKGSELTRITLAAQFPHEPFPREDMRNTIHYNAGHTDRLRKRNGHAQTFAPSTSSAERNR